MKLFSSTVALIGVLLTSSACIPPPQYGVSTNTTTTTQSAPVVSNTGGGVQYLYVPTTNISTTSIQQVIVQTHDGRTFTLGQGHCHHSARS